MKIRSVTTELFHWTDRHRQADTDRQPQTDTDADTDRQTQKDRQKTQTDRQTDKTKLIVAFRNFANAPKNCEIMVSRTPPHSIQ